MSAGPGSTSSSNGGIGRSSVAAEDAPDEFWFNLNDVNYNGAFWCNRASPAPCVRLGGLVDVGSMSGLITNRPQKPELPYRSASTENCAGMLFDVTKRPFGKSLASTLASISSGNRA